MMSTDSTLSHTAVHGGGGKKRTPCPLYGCKRVYTDTGALEAHIKDHEISAESLPGKALLCSSVGCSGSFPNMQKLMEHMRHHHKPNIFFLCENCRTKLRSYRGLLTHLHTCSKAPRGKAKSSESMPSIPAAETNPNLTPIATDQHPPQLESTSTPQELPRQIPILESFLPDAVPQSDSEATPLPTPPLLFNPVPSQPQLHHQQVAVSVSQPQVMNNNSDLPNLAGPTATLNPYDTLSQYQIQTKSPGSAPLSPPGSSAVWKKNQGLACSRRILWEHTKGSYTCVQCGHSENNRKDMTQHINLRHSGNKPVEDMGSSASNA